MSNMKQYITWEEGQRIYDSIHPDCEWKTLVFESIGRQILNKEESIEIDQQLLISGLQEANSEQREILKEIGIGGFLASDLKIGEYAKVVDYSYKGHILLKVYDRIVSLSDPNMTWKHDCTLLIKKINVKITEDDKPTEIPS